ncbi:MAG TPA: hypothetical protein EYQ74_02805 [Planctomycetes bacterium]|nr:hypothetical protein [Planctomycetota bacterium]HIK62241.1 hypothetical protein [Planctomycetota bacterium]
MTWRPHLLVYALVVLALVGVPADRIGPGDLSRSRAERALTSLRISTLARDLERLEGQFNADCERYRGAQLPNLCSAYVEALDGIARRAEGLRGQGNLGSGSQERLDLCVAQPLRLAQLRLDEIETHTLRVGELLEVKRSMQEGLRRGDATSAMVAYKAQCTDGISDFSPDLLLDLLVDLDELAFQATNLRQSGLRDHRIY